MRALFPATFALVVLLACSSSKNTVIYVNGDPNDAGTADAAKPLPPIDQPVSGTVEGYPLTTVKSALATHMTIYQGSMGSEKGVWIAIADEVNTCSAYHLANATFLTLTISAEPLTVGTYPVVDMYKTGTKVPPGSASAEFSKLDNCKQTEYTSSEDGGSVTITEVTPTIKGTVDLRFKLFDDAVRGTFEATDCGNGYLPICTKP